MIGTLVGVALAALIMAYIDTLFSGWAASLIAGAFSNNVNSVVKLLLLSGNYTNLVGSNSKESATTIFETYWEMIGKCFDTVKPFGLALVGTFFIIHAYDVATKEQFTVDSIIKSMIGLVIAVGVIGNLNTIINTLVSIGDSLVWSLYSTLTSKGVDSGISSWTEDQIKEQLIYETSILGGGTTTGLGLWLQALIIWLIAKIAVIGIDMAALSRALELGWRIIFSPIACANAFEGGANSPAIKYLKSILGVALAGPAMLVVAGLGFNLSYGIFSYNTDGLGFFMAAAALLATMGAVMGISNKIKEVVA